MTTGPTDYPASWRPAGAPEPDTAPIEALLLAIDSYISALSESELQALLNRTRERNPR